MGFFNKVAQGFQKMIDPADLSGGGKNLKADELAEKYDTSGMIKPEYAQATNLLTPEGKIMQQYQLQARPDVGFDSSLAEIDARLKGIQLDKRGLEAVRTRALTQGPSDWQKLMLQKQALEEQNAGERAAAQGRGETSSAFSDVARRGGLSSGARERLARSGQRNLSSARQNVLRTGMGQRLDIGTADEQQRLDLLKQLPGMEVQALQPELEKTRLYGSQAESENARRQNLNLANRQYSTDVEKTNLGNTLNEIARKDAAKLAEYQERMRTFAAEKQAAATAQSGGGGKK